MGAKCRSCGADIFWIKNDNTGNNMPLDDEATPDGNIRISDDGREGTVLAGDRLRMARESREKLHLSHFVTCPQRVNWRRR